MSDERRGEREEQGNCPYCDRESGIVTHFYKCSSCGMCYCIKCARRHVCQGRQEQSGELADLRQQLAEARAERDGFQCQLKVFDKLHWGLVDLFDKEARGVSPLHYVKDRIAAQAAELERLHGEFEKSSQRHMESDRSTEEYCEYLRQQIATLRERLEAAEKERDQLQERIDDMNSDAMDRNLCD